jgi:hypothetical protein
MLGAAVMREAPATRRVRATLSVLRHNIVAEVLFWRRWSFVSMWFVITDVGYESWA